MTDNSGKDQPGYPIGSVDRALRLVILVSENPSGIRLGEAALALGVAPSTAHRLLQMLMHQGFARQDGVTRAYFPGETLKRLSDQRERARQLARPLLAELVAEFGETVHLGVLDGVSSLTIVSVESPHMLRVGNREGKTQLAARSAMGRVLISDKDPETLQTMVDAAGLDLAEFTARLAGLSANGCLIQHGEVEQGVSTLAVPVRLMSGAVGYAIGVTYPTGRIDDARMPGLIASVKKAAVQLEKSLHR